MVLYIFSHVKIVSDSPFYAISLAMYPPIRRYLPAFRGKIGEKWSKFSKLQQKYVGKGVLFPIMVVRV